MKVKHFARFSKIQAFQSKFLQLLVEIRKHLKNTVLSVVLLFTSKLIFQRKFYFLSLFAFFPVELLARLGVAPLSTKKDLV